MFFFRPQHHSTQKATISVSHFTSVCHYRNIDDIFRREMQLLRGSFLSEHKQHSLFFLEVSVVKVSHIIVPEETQVDLI